MKALRFWLAQLHSLRPFFWQALALSLGVNTLMVLPSLYMLQVYDRVMVSHNGLTLVVLTLVLTAALLAVAWLETRRTAVLVDMGQQLDNCLASRAHDAALHRELHTPSSSPQQPLHDLNQLRQLDGLKHKHRHGHLLLPHQCRVHELAPLLPLQKPH
jgi:ATP-binding cassette subfamily C exporter for protease/lipase